MRPWLDSFLLDHPVFHIQALEALLEQQGDLGEKVPTLRGLINHLRKKKQIKGIRQRVFRSLTSSAGARDPDPYLVVSQLEPKAVISHRAALHWHLGESAPTKVHFLSQQIAHPWPFGGKSYVPVQDSHPEVGVNTARIGNHQVQVTSAERTLVDLLNRPDLEDDRLETWKDLKRLRLSDEKLLMSYLECLENRTLNAKVAYYLDQQPLCDDVRRHCLHQFGGSKHPLPRTLVSWDQQQSAPGWQWNDGARIRSEWFLQIPEALVKLEQHSAGAPEEAGARTTFEPGTVSREFLEADLLENFRFEGYREGQEELVWKVLDGEDALGVLPTGQGKSLTYLQPSMLLNGPTIVISPLIALIDDQIMEARAFEGLNAFALNRANRDIDLPKVREHLRDGKLHLIFIPPESWPWLFRTLPRLRTLTRQIVVDEAHVLVEWGQHFRRAYRHLGRIREKCSAPVLALTATATIRTQGEIIRGLKLEGIKPRRHSVRKGNLTLRVERTALPDGRRIPRYLPCLTASEKSGLREVIYKARLKILKPYLAERPGVRGIIYCERKVDANLLASELQGSGVGPVETYHGDQTRGERLDRLMAFKKGDIQIMVATVAFGLGVNMKEIGFVIHFGMPTSLDAYTQAIGRGGRDDNPADCLVIHVDGEEAILNWLAALPIGGGYRSVRSIRRRKGQIQAVVDWLSTQKCRHASLDEYFGIKDGEPCGNRCDYCSGEPNPG